MTLEDTPSIEPMDFVDDDMTVEQVRDRLSRVDILGFTEPPSRYTFPVAFASYFLRLDDTQDADAEATCELCQREAVVKTNLQVNTKEYPHTPLCEVCAHPVEPPAPENFRETYPTRVGTPIEHLDDEVVEEIHERFGFADI